MVQFFYALSCANKFYKREKVMRKKIMLLLGMALCLLVIGGTFATSYFNANLDGLIRTDAAISLNLGQSGEITEVTLSEKEYTVYTIETNVSASATAGEVSAALAINITDGQDDKTLENVSFVLYSDAECTTLVEGVVVVNNEDERSLTLSGISKTTTFYLAIFVTPKAEGERYTAAELRSIGGRIAVSFEMEGGNA